MKWVGILPWVHRPYYEACMATMVPAFKKNVMAIDNSVVNRGIMWAHNKGMHRMLEVKADWLIILGASVRFGKPGGLDFIKVLEDHPDHYVIHAASENVQGGKQQTEEGGGHNKVFGWHCTAFSRECLEKVGGWDTNFSPYSLCDIDMSIRIQKAYKGAAGWNTFPINVSDEGMSHGINKAGVKAAYPPRHSYFIRKWGREGGEWQKEAYDHPFNDPTKPLSYYPAPNEPLSIWQNEYKTGGYNYED